MYVYSIPHFADPFTCQAMLGCVSVLAIVKNVVNVNVQKSVQVTAFILLDIYLEAELLDHIIILCIIFWGTTIIFSTVPVSFYFPPDMHKSSNFSTFLWALFFLGVSIIPIFLMGMNNEIFYGMFSYIMVPTNLNQHKIKHVVRDQVSGLMHKFIWNTAYICKRQSVEDLELKDLLLSSSCRIVCMILENFLNFSEFQLPYP